MANTIKIKRSTTTATPSTLAEGELAYSENSQNLFIGTSGGNITRIGGTSSSTNFIEDVQDIIGDMVSSNTENGIAVTYDDATGKINFDVNDPTLTYTGDVTGSGTVTNLGNTSIALTLGTSGVTAGTYNNSATAVTPITVDAKGRVTATGSAVTITPAVGSISGLGSGVSAFLATPTSANLATAVTDETGSGSLVFNTAPTFIGKVAFDSATASHDTLAIQPNTSTGTSFEGVFVPAELTAARTYTMPDVTGTVVTSGDTGTVTNTMLAGSIANSKLENNSVTVGTTEIALGASSTTLAGLTNVTSTAFTGALTGNADTATKFATGRTIAITGDITYTSPSFDGSANVTAAGTLATVNTNVGSFGSGSVVPTVTVNGKGLVTAVSTTSIPSATTSTAGFMSSTDKTRMDALYTWYTNMTTADANSIIDTINEMIAAFNNAPESLNVYSELTTPTAMTLDGGTF